MEEYTITFNMLMFLVLLFSAGFSFFLVGIGELLSKEIFLGILGVIIGLVILVGAFVVLALHQESYMWEATCYQEGTVIFQEVVEINPNYDRTYSQETGQQIDLSSMECFMGRLEK